MRKLDRIPKAVYAILAAASLFVSLVKTDELNAQNREMIELARSLKATCR